MVRKEWSVAYNGGSVIAQRVNRSSIGFWGAFEPDGLTGGAVDEGAGAGRMGVGPSLRSTHHFGAHCAQGFRQGEFNWRRGLGCKHLDAALDGEEAGKSVVIFAGMNHHGYQLSRTRQHVLVGYVVECVSGSHGLGVGRSCHVFKGLLESGDRPWKRLVRERWAAKISHRNLKRDSVDGARQGSRIAQAAPPAQPMRGFVMWDRRKLEDMAGKRKAAQSVVNEALLAFARSREMTDEAGIDVKAEELALTAALDRLEPEAMESFKALGSVERDEVLRDFVVRVIDHNQQRMDRELAQIEAMEGPALEEQKHEEAAPRKQKKRGLRLG